MKSINRIALVILMSMSYGIKGSSLHYFNAIGVNLGMSGSGITKGTPEIMDGVLNGYSFGTSSGTCSWFPMAPTTRPGFIWIKNFYDAKYKVVVKIGDTEQEVAQNSSIVVSVPQGKAAQSVLATATISCKTPPCE